MCVCMSLSVCVYVCVCVCVCECDYVMHVCTDQARNFYACSHKTAKHQIITVFVSVHAEMFTSVCVCVHMVGWCDACTKQWISAYFLTYQPCTTKLLYVCQYTQIYLHLWLRVCVCVCACGSGEGADEKPRIHFHFHKRFACINARK